MRKIVIEIICLLFVILFVYTAMSKMIDYERFKVTIAQSPLLTNMAGFVAFFIPLIEIIASIMLVIPKWRLLGLYLSFTLMVMFTAYIIAILNFSERVPCSCGGVVGKMGWSAHLLFNVVFLALSIAAIVLYKRGGDESRRKFIPA